MSKILLVEDDTNLSEIYAARLQAEGFEVVAAHNGEEALATAVKEQPNLIILDVMMPKISGFDVLDILRQTPETKNTKVIMMTALSQKEDQERGKQLGADKYLVKSQVTLEDVVAAVNQVLTGQPAQPQPQTQQPQQNQQTSQEQPQTQQTPQPAKPQQNQPQQSQPAQPTQPQPAETNEKLESEINQILGLDDQEDDSDQQSAQTQQAEPQQPTSAPQGQQIDPATQPQQPSQQNQQTPPKQQPQNMVQPTQQQNSTPLNQQPKSEEDDDNQAPPQDPNSISL